MESEKTKQRVLAAEARLGINQRNDNVSLSAPGRKAPEAMNEDEAYEEVA